MVCCIDCIWPPRRDVGPPPAQQQKKREDKKVRAIVKAGYATF